MEYTEKTSGAQIVQFIHKVVDEQHIMCCELTYDNGNVGVRRLYDLPSIGRIHEALVECGINPQFVTIDTMWNHLTMWFCNWDGTDIDIED